MTQESPSPTVSLQASAEVQKPRIAETRKDLTSSAPIAVPSTVEKREDSVKLSEPKPIKPKVNPGAVYLRILDLSIHGFSVASPGDSSIKKHLKAPIEVEYDMQGRETGPELHEIDALLFLAQDKFASPKEWLEYLLWAYSNTLRYKSHDWQAVIARSLATQIFLVLQQQPEFVQLLVNRVMSSCAMADVFGRKDGLSAVEYEELLLLVFGTFSLSELESLFSAPIDWLVQSLVRSASIASDFYPLLRTLQALFSVPILRRVLQSHAYWHVHVPSGGNRILPHIFNHTILGAILAVSCANQSDLNLARLTSQQATVSVVNEVRTQTRALRNTLTAAHACMIRIAQYLVQEEDGERALFDWIAKNISQGPLKPHSMQYALQWAQNLDLQRLDGLYLNLTLVLLHLHAACATQTSQASTDALLDSIDPSFIENNAHGIIFPEKAKLFQSDAVEDQEMESGRVTNRASFDRHNALFFTTWFVIHSTYIPVVDHFKNVLQQLAKMMNQERQLSAAGTNPQHVEALKQAIGSLSTKLFSMHSAMVLVAEDTLKFFEFSVGSWLYRSGMSQAVDTSTCSSVLKRVPSFMLESVVQYLNWRVILEKGQIPIVETPAMTPISSKMMRCFTTLFESSSVANYHLLTSSVGLFSVLFDSSASTTAPPLLTATPSEDIDALVVPLINYYVNVEKTGSRAAFYEKFPVRRHIASLLRLPSSKRRLLQACVEPKVFFPFMTVLLNDNLFLLDETLLKLNSIHDSQNSLSRLNAIENKSREELQAIQETQRALEEALGQLRALSTFGNDSFLLFEVLSSISLQSIVENAKKRKLAPSAASSSSGDAQTDIPVPVMLDSQLLDQLSVMMNYFLDHFSSPTKRKKLFLREQNESEHSMAFNPRQILSCLILTYLNVDQMCLLLHSLGCAAVEASTFQTKIVSESRSYNISVFEAALEIVLQKAIVFSPTALRELRLEWRGAEDAKDESSLPASAWDAITIPMRDMELQDVAPFVVERWRWWLAQLKRREEETKNDEIPESEIPEHFLDELLATLMRDPVKLPSGHVVDRSTIVRQLAGHDKSDPFTRLPLTLEQVEAQVDLKQEIDSWILERRRRLKKEEESSKSENEKH